MPMRHKNRLEPRIQKQTESKARAADDGTTRARTAPEISLQQRYALGTILYVIVLDAKDAGEYTLFQGFSLNAVDAFGPTREICKFPAHVDELFRSRGEVAHWRMFGQTSYSILLLELEYFEQLNTHPGFVCVVSSSANHSAVSKHFARRDDKRWLHVTTKKEPTKEFKLWEMNRFSVYEWVKEALTEVASAIGGSEARHFQFSKLVEWDKVRAPVRSRHHNVLTPTETVYLSLGYHYSSRANRLAGNEDVDFAKALVGAARALERSLKQLTAGGKRPPGCPTMILTVPSVFRHLASSRPRKGTTAVVRKAVRAVLRQKQYIAFRATAEESTDFLGSDIARSIMSMRASELFLYTAAVTAAACSLCCPALRLPPQLDRARDLLVGITTLSRKGNEAQRRRNKLVLRVGQMYRSLIPLPLIELIDGLANKGVKLIGDVPLELLPIQGLPLSLRCSVSRLPTLPGNLLVRHSLMRMPMYLKPSDFYDVLVVRSFKPGDPLRKLVEVSVPVVLRNDSNIKVRVVDVTNEEEFLEAFNSFDGTLAIFDGHGTHAADESEGTLQIGDLRLNPMGLYKRIKVPPIIILSACETHTIEGFESSVASAFLFMGARSVIGTIAPIEAMSAATLVARFLYRLDAFLPLFKHPVGWTEVVTGMLRMSYVTDILRKFEQLHELPQFHLSPVQMVANMAINTNDFCWFEATMRSLAEHTNESEEQVRERWLDTCYFTETLRYVHLGIPEHIFVVPE